MVIHKCVVKNLPSPFKEELICRNISNWYVLTLFAGYSGGVSTFSKSKKKDFCHLCIGVHDVSMPQDSKAMKRSK